MIDWTEISDGDTWELFARDFLSELGFEVELAPGRGPDAGRDLIVSEQVKGTLHARKFRWLVSCKHNSSGGSAVGSQEIDITDRCTRNDAQGFMGFYSTMASASLIDRLKDLKQRGELEAFEIFDHRRIESSIVAAGMTKIVLRYLAKSYGRLRPIQSLFGKYTSLNCAVCDKDVLASSINNSYAAIIVWAFNKANKNECDEVHVVCKGNCDREITETLSKRGYVTGWEDISDMCNPLYYLKKVMGYMNQLHLGDRKYSKPAHEKMKNIFLIIAQRTLREITKEDEDRFSELQATDGL
jgi:hypothetical protein